MTKTSYPAPVQQLFTLGSVESTRAPWLDYKALGLTQEHISLLLSMATDLDLNLADEKIPTVWAPLHAWRALAQLRAVEAIGPLLDLYAELVEDDWLLGDLPQVIELLGPRTVDALAAYLQRYDNSDERSGYLGVLEGLGRLGRKYPEVRRRVIQILIHHLADYLENDDGFNGWLIDELVQLRARQALPLIAAAFVQNEDEGLVVDEMVVDWEDVCKAFGLPPTAEPSEFVQA
jgi:hypothetical protein